MKNLPTIDEQIKIIKAALVQSQQAIVMIGLMGAGKTKLGKELAKALDVQFVDSDDVIENNHGAISEYFKIHGEPKFRRLERDTISTFVRGAPKVLSTGGGAFMDDETRSLINSNAVSVWLHISPADTMARFDEAEIAKRPLLANAPEGAIAKLTDLYAQRADTYSQAHLRVDLADDGATKQESIAQNRDRVINALYKHLKPA